MSEKQPLSPLNAPEDRVRAALQALVDAFEATKSHPDKDGATYWQMLVTGNQIQEAREALQ